MALWNIVLNVLRLPMSTKKAPLELPDKYQLTGELNYLVIINRDQRSFYSE